MIYLYKIKFVWFKQSIFEPNENLLKSNKFYALNQTNYIFHHIPMD